MVEYGNRWGSEGPPPEAYSRVTNPERFHPLHPRVDRLVAELCGAFDAARHELAGRSCLGYDAAELERTPLRVQPRGDRSAPITIVFTPFPGIRALFGRWHEEAFPNCGCDACDETADSAFEHLSYVVEAVTRGQFGEAVAQDEKGLWWRQYELIHPSGDSSRGSSSLAADGAGQLLGGDLRSPIRWRPWDRRSQSSGAG